MLDTLPVTTITVVQSFSTLQRLKNFLRNNLKQDRLTGLALVSIYRSDDIAVDEVINRFVGLPQNINCIYL